MDGPGRSWKGIFESCFLSNPKEFKGAGLPERQATVFPLQLNPEPSASESFNPLICDWKSISVVPKTPAVEKYKWNSSKNICFKQNFYQVHTIYSYSFVPERTTKSLVI